MAAVNLLKSLERIDGTSVRERTEGLADLKHVLRHNQRSSRVDGLGDKAFHRIYEVLFRIAVIEKSTYLKASKPTLRHASSGRLSSCASTLRLAVEVGGRSLLIKTVNALLDHIIEILPLASGGFCEPLAVDYAKSLKSLLSYQPHVEHLTANDWEKAALFCTENLKQASSELNEDSLVGAEQSINSNGNGHSYRSSRSAIRDSAESQGMRPMAKQVAEELIGCVRQLTAAPNAAFARKGSKLLFALVAFLQSSPFTGRSHQDTFVAVNDILAWSTCEAVSVTHKITSQLLRLIRHFWSRKSAGLKDEMIITLLQLRPYFHYAMQQDDRVTVRAELTSLYDMLRGEYSKRQEREQLQLDDLVLDLATTRHASGTIRTSKFSLRCTGPRAEHSWALISLFASFCHALLPSHSVRADSCDLDNGDQPRKRQKITDSLDDLLASTRVPINPIKICALQSISFFVQQVSIPVDLLDKILAKLTLSCNDDSSSAGSWAFLAAAACLTQPAALDPSVAVRWTSLWQVGFRCMSTAGTSRAASHLLRIMVASPLVTQASIADLVNIVTSAADLNGPSVLAESTLALVTVALRQARQLNPSSGQAASESALGWLFRKFSPSKFDDRQYISSQTLYSAGDISMFVQLCLSQYVHCLGSSTTCVWGHIGQSWLACEGRHSLVSYLLLSEDRNNLMQTLSLPGSAEKQLGKASFPSALNSETVLLNYLSNELSRTLDQWRTWKSDRLRNVTADMLSFLCKVCCIIACVSHCTPFRDTKSSSQLRDQASQLLKGVTEVLAGSPSGPDKVNIILAGFCDFLPMTAGQSCQDNGVQEDCVVEICSHLTSALKARHQAKDLGYGIDDDQDPMNMDDIHDSQDTGTRVSADDTVDIRSDRSNTYSVAANRLCMSAYARIVDATSKERSQIESGGSASSAIVDYLLELPVNDVLASRSVLADLPALGLYLGVSDTERLLGFFAEQVLRDYAYERSEVATGTILDVMSSLTLQWTDPTNKSLFGLGLDIYDWYTSTALSAGVLSPNVQQKVASLLLKLSHVNTDYGSDSDVPSVRTSLFHVLQIGGMPVKFHLAERISTIFGLFVLSTHDAMFEDLQSSLPTDPDWMEGMALRLLFLSKLASAWHSLLRPCVYHIFETAGQVKSAVRHAAYCIDQTAKGLGFETPQELFALFAPQLLYTWLDEHPLVSIPYSAFNYQSLKELLELNKSEITAQLLMRGNDAGVHIIADGLKTTAEQLLLSSFGRCLAYAIAWDISTPTLSGESSSASESRLRVLVKSKEAFKALTMQQFPLVVGTFFLTMQQDDAILEKGIDKRPAYQGAAFALQEMKSFSASSRLLPKTQQPSFRSKYLIDEIERLCRRTGHDPVCPWDASSLTLAIRMMLNVVHDALGSLHKCLIIRKLRILICLAGEVSLSGLPVELLLQSLRRFLLDSQCADDAMGIMKYLYTHGRQYLQANMTFTTGVTVLTLLTMRRHVSTTQDSTTQESQHKATIKTMQDFHAWLTMFLRDSSNHQSPATKSTFGHLVNAVAHAQLPGNGRAGSSESSLLRLLLHENSGKSLLMGVTDTKEALALLCQKFEPPQTLKEDSLGSDEEAIRYAEGIWESLQVDSADDRYLAWAGAVLGRCYSANGPLKFKKLHNVPLLDQKSHGRDIYTVASETAIMESLVKLLHSPSRQDAALAEYTLRSIAERLSEAGDAEAALGFEQMLPNSVSIAVSGGTCGYEPPTISFVPSSSTKAEILSTKLVFSPELTAKQWAMEVASTLCRHNVSDPLLGTLVHIVTRVDGLAESMLPYIIHLLLFRENDRDQLLRHELSLCCQAHFVRDEEEIRSKQQLLLNVILYLRSQPFPGENTKADRLRWLDIEFQDAAGAAARCSMPTCSLLLAESRTPASPSSRRTSQRSSISRSPNAAVDNELLLSIFMQIDEPDSFYGVQQTPSLDSVVERLDYEGNGFKSLMFHSARLDSKLRQIGQLTGADSSALVRSLASLNLNSVTLALLSSRQGSAATATESMAEAARKLEQWDVGLSETLAGTSTAIFRVFHDLHNATALPMICSSVNTAIIEQIRSLKASTPKRASQRYFAQLAILTEINEVLDVRNSESLASTWDRFSHRQEWMHLGRREDFQQLVSSRETLFSTLSGNKNIQSELHVGQRESRTIEVAALAASSALYRKHSLLQEALGAATHMTELSPVCESLGLKIEAATRYEVANVLWDHSETTSSIQLLRNIKDMKDLDTQTVPVGRPGLLSQLGHQLAEARLEKPDDILSQYLKPAIEELGNRNQGQEAGKVFHEFASFCDEQLENPGNVEEFLRIAKLRTRKLEEASELEQMLKSKKSAGDKEELSRGLHRARKWFKIDDAEFQRLKESRDAFVQQSLQNYLLALHACDDFNPSVLRFFALWLGHSESEPASQIVQQYLPQVPSWKFIMLMNQVMSRVQQDRTTFQQSLKALVIRIGAKHPHHSLFHIYSSSRTKPGSAKDESAVNRFKAAQNIKQQLLANNHVGDMLHHIFEANDRYHDLAEFSAKELPKNSGGVSTRDVPPAAAVTRKIPELKVPPATVTVAIRPDGAYQSVPRITRFSSTIRIATGLSAPKVLVAYASDGQAYKQLFKGGDDELRQDSIMEQVFEEVSKMLQNHKATRQRNLHVRTYKVIPLSPKAGIIEFVPNSIPLNDFLNPAHAKYHPGDMKGHAARDKIRNMQDHGVGSRVKTFKQICDSLQPVLRHFFLERFDDPDQWFEKRTAYTRTTATISILGHILGLGDRHCHNILLDEKSGDVVHIDLGVAFEAGRILTVPELIPFRLSRDIVDGFGITKTEGVFRRSCEFTLDALREDKSSIMTLLNVLRYDPLYSWSVSPLRAKRMQAAQDGGHGVSELEAAAQSSKKTEEEAGEADRALSIVEKKLSKNLSTAATVNELIQQATDEKNLALLFCGWSAYY